jgi:hypothetical protein
LDEVMADEFDILETDYGIEISVRDTETADEFDDFLVEERDIDCSYLRPIDDGMIFGLGKGFTRSQAEELLEAFLQSRSTTPPATP